MASKTTEDTMDNEKQFAPRALSLEQIIQQQEMAMYGRVLTASSGPARKPTNTIIPIKVEAR